MARTKIQIDLRKVEEYAQVCDSEEEIAFALGISQDTLTRRKQEYADFAEAIKRGKAKANVFVGDTASIIFYMKARCGWKETSRNELSGANGGAIKVDATPDLSGVDLDKLKAVKEMLYGNSTADTDRT